MGKTVREGAYLLAELQNAERGDEKLGAEVVAYIIGGFTIQSPINGRWCVYRGPNGRMGPRLWQPKNNDPFEERIHYFVRHDSEPTSTIDAAVALLPEHISYELTCSAVPEKALKRCRLWDWRRCAIGFDGNEWIGEVNSTLPIAICIAAIKHRMETEG